MFFGERSLLSIFHKSSLNVWGMGFLYYFWYGVYDFLAFNIGRILRKFVHSQAGPLPLLEWKGEAETVADAHVGVGGVAQVPERHTDVSSLNDYGDRGALARRPEENLLVAVTLILVLGVAVIDLMAAAARG